jgi:hypothetical protein
MIDDYLAALRRALRRRLLIERRLLSETEAHLRESAARLGSEREAIERFGDPEGLARRVARERAPRRAAVLFLATLPFFVLPLYAIPENTLPAAPWASTPGYLQWKRDAALALFAAAAALAVAGLRSRLALLASVGALGACVCLTAVLAVQWHAAVPGSDMTLLLTCIVGCLCALASAAALAAPFVLARR